MVPVPGVEARRTRVLDLTFQKRASYLRSIDKGWIEPRDEADGQGQVPVITGQDVVARRHISGLMVARHRIPPDQAKSYLTEPGDVAVTVTEAGVTASWVLDDLPRAVGRDAYGIRIHGGWIAPIVLAELLDVDIAGAADFVVPTLDDLPNDSKELLKLFIESVAGSRDRAQNEADAWNHVLGVLRKMAPAATRFESGDST